MVFVHLNKEGFQNDIHSLVKAFFPSENVSVCIADKRQKAGAFQETNTAGLVLWVDHLKERVSMALYERSLYESGSTQERKEGDKQADTELCETDNMEERKRDLCAQDFKNIWKDADFLREELRKSEKWERKEEVYSAINYSNKKSARNIVKQSLYRILSSYTGKALPWGTLTGVRPVKIPMAMIEAGETKRDIAQHMMSAFYTSEQKTDLSIQIAQRELRLLQKLDYQNGYSLYIGIPFCPSTCLYCSFTSYPVFEWAGRVDEYLDALEKEICAVAKMLSGKCLNSIYIGGGTPTTLTPRQLERLLTCIESKFDFSDLIEYTVEAGRPDSITKEKLEALRAHKIKRISINPQTMKQQTLDLIGRRHTVTQTQESFWLARSMGFENINMDLIMGLPNETLSDVQNTMEKLREMQPDNITVHSLALKRTSRLNMEKEAYAGLQIVNTQQHLDAARKVCEQMGMRPYYLYRQKNMAGNFENVGYAKEGKEGIYNVLIMEEKQTIVACGAGSISKRVYPGGRIERSENVKDVALYIQKIDEMIERKRKLLEE